MGSWANLTLDDDVMDGIAPVDLRDREFGKYDTDAISTNVQNEAKGYIEMDLYDRFPEMIRDADGPGEYLDAALDINKTDITNLINRTLGYCTMWQYYEQQALSPNSIQIDRSLMMEKKYQKALSALVKQLRIDEDFVDQIESTVDDDMDKHSAPTWVG